MSRETHHTPTRHLHPRQPPPAHYYADNLLALVDTVHRRYGDLLVGDERAFGERILSLSVPGKRLLARLIARKGPLIRDDSLAYREVDDVEATLAELEAATLVQRCPPAPLDAVLKLLTRAEIGYLFAWDIRDVAKAGKAVQVARILASSPGCLGRWRIKRAVAWLALRQVEHLDLYRLLFFGDLHQDLTTFVMRDLGVFRYEPVVLSRKTRLFSDRAALARFLELAAAQEEIAALGERPDASTCHAKVAELLARLWCPMDNRMLERRRSRTLNRLGRNLERVGDFDAALSCYGRSTLAPARERRMRILHRLGDEDGVESLRTAILAQPQTILEADFAARFARPFRRPPAPMVERTLGGAVPASIEAHALALLTTSGGIGWHLENHLPMAVFALAYWSWMFAPVEGAFVNAFQTGPVDLFWPDFFVSREGVCEDPLHGALKSRLRSTMQAKAGTANRLFSWQRCPPTVIEAVLEAIPEADLRALVEIVHDDLDGRRSGFPDLTVVYAPGRYEFVEVKGPNDQLQIHQRLWIQALQGRGLPVRVMRFRTGK